MWSSIVIELEFRDVAGFYGGRKNRKTQRKPLEQGKNQQLKARTQPTCDMYRAGVEPGSQWCEASALTHCDIPAPNPGSRGELVILDVLLSSNVCQ